MLIAKKISKRAARLSFAAAAVLNIIFVMALLNHYLLLFLLPLSLSHCFFLYVYLLSFMIQLLQKPGSKSAFIA